MQGETNQHSLIERSPSPHDREPNGYSQEHTVTEETYILESDKVSDVGDDKTSDQRFEKEDSCHDVPSCDSNRNQENLSPESVELRQGLENGELDKSEQDFNQHHQQSYQDNGHFTNVPQGHKWLEAHNIYTDAHAHNFNDVNQHSLSPPISSVPPNGWQYSRQGLSYSGCEDHPYPHGYFFMPCYPGSGYQFAPANGVGGKPVPGVVSNVSYQENAPFPEPIPIPQYGFPFIETGRNMARMVMGAPNQTTPIPNYVYDSTPSGRPHGLPPIWPSFAEKAPVLGYAKDCNANVLPHDDSLPVSRSADVPPNQSSTYLYLPPNDYPVSLVDNNNHRKGATQRTQRSRGKSNSRVKAGFTPEETYRPNSTNSNSTGASCLQPCECKWIVCENEGGQKQRCSGQFPSAMDLAKHISADHVYRSDNQAAYVCLWEGCQRQNRPFKARYKLVNHLRVHTGERPYKCKHPGCERTFARTENLKIHARGHSGEKPYPCPYDGCEKKFSNSSDRKKHQRSHESRV